MTDTPHPAAVLGRPGQAYEASQLRWASTRDAERLSALWRGAYPDTDHADLAMHSWLEHGGALMLEDRGGALLSALRWRHTADGWEVDRVATLPAHRGQGYGRWLMTRVEAAAIRANIPYLSLLLPPDASPGQVAYYTRMGYQDQAGDAAGIALRKRVGGTWQTKSPGAGQWLGGTA